MKEEQKIKQKCLNTPNYLKSNENILGTAKLRPRLKENYQKDNAKTRIADCSQQYMGSKSLFECFWVENIPQEITSCILSFDKKIILALRLVSKAFNEIVTSGIYSSLRSYMAISFKDSDCLEEKLKFVEDNDMDIEIQDFNVLKNLVNLLEKERRPELFLKCKNSVSNLNPINQHEELIMFRFKQVNGMWYDTEDSCKENEDYYSQIILPNHNEPVE